MYLSIILTDSTGHEVAQKAVPTCFDKEDLKSITRGLANKYGKDVKDLKVSVVQWNGQCYDVLYKELVID